jgi:dihydroorotase-like cyclic amidohydrolase
MLMARKENEPTLAQNSEQSRNSADFSILDLDSPELVRGEDIRSKCGWSPYEEKEFPGRARWTVV